VHFADKPVKPEAKPAEKGDKPKIERPVGPAEAAVKSVASEFKPPGGIDPSVVRPAPAGKKQYPTKVRRLADEMVNLTMLEAIDLTDLLKEHLGMTTR
jgi:hypothetical protein